MLCLAHFCEIHGPMSIMVTQSFPADAAIEHIPSGKPQEQEQSESPFYSQSLRSTQSLSNMNKSLKRDPPNNNRFSSKASQKQTGLEKYGSRDGKDDLKRLSAGTHNKMQSDYQYMKPLETMRTSSSSSNFRLNVYNGRGDNNPHPTESKSHLNFNSQKQQQRQQKQQPQSSSPATHSYSSNIPTQLNPPNLLAKESSSYETDSLCTSCRLTFPTVKISSKNTQNVSSTMTSKAARPAKQTNENSNDKSAIVTSMRTIKNEPGQGPTVYLSTQYPQDADTYSTLRRECLKILSSETSFNDSTPIMVSDPGFQSHAIGLAFKVFDERARGYYRKYAFICHCDTERLLMQNWRIITRHLIYLKGYIQRQALQAHELEKMKQTQQNDGDTTNNNSNVSGASIIESLFSKLATEQQNMGFRLEHGMASGVTYFGRPQSHIPRSLTSITKNDNFYGELHSQFTYILSTLNRKYV